MTIKGRLPHVRRQMRAEERQAKRWLATNWHLVEERPPDDRTLLFGSSNDLDSWTEGTGRAGSVVSGKEGATLHQLDAQQRVAHCLAKLKPEHQELLRARYMEGRTLEDIAADMGVTRQAVHQRMMVAHSEFHRAVGQHWNDVVGIRIEDL